MLPRLRGPAALIACAALAFMVGMAGVLAASVLRGYDPDEVVVPLAEWTLETPAGARDLHLPVRLDVDAVGHDPVQRLRARVTVPESLRGRRLYLAVNFSWARLALVADGREALLVEGSFLGLERARGPHLFAIDAEASADGELVLELTSSGVSGWGVWFDVVPRLSASPGGDAQYRLVRLFNDGVSIAALVGMLMMSLVYGTVWLFDQKNRAAALYAISSDFALVAPLFALGIAGPVLDRWEVPLFAFGFWAAAVAATHYLHASFELGPPPRLFAWSVVVMAIAAAVLGWLAPSALLPLLVVLGVPLAGWLVPLHLRAWRKPRHRIGARLSMLAWGLLVALLIPEALIQLGVGAFTLGLHPLSLGVLLYSMGQATVIAHDRVAAARATEQLTVELRHQVAERSRQLADALTRLGEAARAPARLGPGDVIQERYRVVRALGAGGMGTVYEVERLADGQALALKILAGAPTPAALARFAREAQIAAELHHPNLVPVLDVGISHSGSMFLVMELVEGRSLEQERARFGDVAWATRMCSQVAAGLQAMHARGIVHRDLKPANVLVEPGPPQRARIADFGIAFLGGDEETGADAFAETAAEISPALTRPGAIMGTPAYMAPELTGGAQAARPAVDVFAFGVLAYELLTGERPFATPPLLARLGAQAVEPARPLAERGGAIPAALAQLVDRCLALDPAARPSAGELHRALDVGGEP